VEALSKTFFAKMQFLVHDDVVSVYDIIREAQKFIFVMFSKSLGIGATFLLIDDSNYDEKMYPLRDMTCFFAVRRPL